MDKYDFETIIKYVNGEDIEKYEIDELENDYLFMIQVILYTNDKNTDVLYLNEQYMTLLLAK